MKEEEYARRHPVKTLEGTGGHEERSVGGSVEVGGGRGGGSTSKCAHALSCVYSCTRGAVELCVRVTYVCALFFFSRAVAAALHTVGDDPESASECEHLVSGGARGC